VTYLNAGSFKIIKFKEIDSTNSYLRTNYNDLKKNFPLIVFADFQKRGRGRDTRLWHSGKNLGIYCSIGINLKNIENINFLSLAAGISVSEFLTQLTGEEFTLKWPNDVLFNGNKIAGILIENIIFDNEISSIIGIGININSTRKDFPEELKEKATSLKIIKDIEFNIELIKVEMLKNVVEWINVLENENLTLIIKRFNELSLSMIDKKIAFHYNEKLIEGIYRGIGNDGGIVIKDDRDNEKIYYSGEIIRIKE